MCLDILEKQFNISYFIKTGNFKLSKKILKKIHKNNHAEFCNDNIKMIYFYFHGYNVVFLSKENNIYHSQVEITNWNKLKNKFLKKISSYEDLNMMFFEKMVFSAYGDDDERVIILNSGVILYYNLFDKKYFLRKIIQYDKNSIELIKKLLTNIFKNPKTFITINEC